MKVSKPIILYLPELLVSELKEFLLEYQSDIKLQKIYFYYVVYHLIVMQNHNKDKEYQNINMKLLKSLTISNIDRYIKILVNGEFIISDKSYKPGVKSLSYKLNPKFVSGITKKELDSDNKIGKKIIRKLYQKRAHDNRLEPHLKHMKNEFMKTELDYDKADKWAHSVSDNSKKLVYLTSINHIKDKRFRYFKRNKTNKRLDTNLTNLKSNLRHFIIGDYVSIDLKNSQPFLLGIVIDNIINNRVTLCSYLHVDIIKKTFGIKAFKEILLLHHKQEKSKMVKFSKFFEYVSNGVLYDEFIESYSQEITRKETKNIIFKVLFSRNHCFYGSKKIIPYKKEKKAFASVYPFVSRIVSILKKKDHRTLPIYLQRLESYLFIDCIAKELVDFGIVPLTIHDSVIVKAEDVNKTIEIMNGIFLKEIGLIPTFDINKLN